jgi:membrane protein
MRPIKTSYFLLRDAVTKFADDDAFTLSGALAFYTALSFGPLVILLLALAGTLGPGATNRLVHQIEDLIGPKASEAVRLVIESADDFPDATRMAGIIGLATLIFSATTVFAQLQSSLNVVWEVEAKPGKGVWAWLRQRLLSLGMIFAFAFLLIVSLGVSAFLAFMIDQLGVLLPAVHMIASVVVFTGLFALIFKILPDVKLKWLQVLPGAAVTAGLFTVGKFVIGIYLGNSAVGSAYGAAGSLVVLLVWVYYSSLIVFFGAELTRAWVLSWGGEVRPTRFAILKHHFVVEEDPNPTPAEASAS